MHIFILTIALTFLISCQNKSSDINSVNKKPNIIIIFADDMGVGDVSGLNPKGKIHTPNLDNMINNGIFFSDAHTSSSVCTPSRYSLLTGRYNWRSKLKRGVTWGYSGPVIEKNRTTLATLLKKNDYHTALIGKWHLGWNWKQKQMDNVNQRELKKMKKKGWHIDYTKKITAGPLDNGFDYFFGIPASLDMSPYVYIRNNSVVTLPTTEKAFHRLGAAAEDFEAIETLPTLTKEAVKYINSQASNTKKGKPFFLYFALPAPHTPILPTKEWQDKSKIKTKYADFTMQVDDTVGQVLEALKKNNIEENTLVLFTADNGCSPEANYATHLSKGHNPSSIYRGHKADLYEGGHRVPFIIQWKKKIKESGERKNLVVTTDLLKTFANILGTELKDNEGEDSIGFEHLLSDSPSKESKRNRAIHHSIKGAFAIRDGDWKLVIAHGSGGWTPQGERYRIKRKKYPKVNKKIKHQLYNLKNDVGEYKNLAKQHPEIVKRLRKLLNEDIKNGRSTPGEKQKNNGKVRVSVK